MKKTVKNNEKVTAKKSAIAYCAENRFGIEKSFNDKKRKERYELKQQLMLLCATVADQLRIELTSAVNYGTENNVIPEFDFCLKNRFKQSWRNTESQIKNTLTGDALSVYEGEKHAFGLYLKRLNPNWNIVFEKETYTIHFKEKVTGLNPDRKLSKNEQAFFGMLDDMKDNGIE